jgi:hypothetical protein
VPDAVWLHLRFWKRAVLEIFTEIERFNAIAKNDVQNSFVCWSKVLK